MRYSDVSVVFQVGLDEGGEDGEGVTPNQGPSEAGSPLPRAASEMTQKTADGSKVPEVFCFCFKNLSKISHFESFVEAKT